MRNASQPARTRSQASCRVHRTRIRSRLQGGLESVAAINNRDTNRTQSFTYDELNRIKTAQSQAPSGANCWGNSFAYDIWANLLTKTVTKCTAESLSVAVSTKNQITNPSFTYDAAGNLTNSGAGVMTYDAENRITTAAGVTYSYDGDGKRVKKSNGKLYWTGMGSDALAETDLAGVIQSEFTFFNGRRVARRDGSGNTVFYYFSDHLGSADVITNATGTILDESDYYPFGGELVLTNSDPNPYKFTGKERDTESGLDYFIARHYSSSLGRFLQADSPFADQQGEDPQSWNLYSYVRDNPLNNADPTGRTCQTNSSDGKVYDNLDGKGCSAVEEANKKAKPDVTVTTEPPPDVMEPGVNYGTGNLAGGCPLGSCHTYNGLYPPLRPIAIINMQMFLGFTTMVLGTMGSLPASDAGLKGEEITYLYEKVGPNGEHLKYGITKNPATRYTAAQLGGGHLKILANGSRSEMLKLERALHETMPIGPEEAQSYFIDIQVEKGYKAPPY